MFVLAMYRRLYVSQDPLTHRSVVLHWWLLARDTHATKWLHAVGLECLHGPLTSWTDGVRDGPSYISYNISSMRPSHEVEESSRGRRRQSYWKVLEVLVSDKLGRPLRRLEASAPCDLGTFKNKSIHCSKADAEILNLTLAQIHKLQRIRHLAADIGE